MKCLLCKNDIKFSMLDLIKEKNNLCIQCLNKFEVVNSKEVKTFKMGNNKISYELNILLAYNDVTKNYMYYLKEKKDLELVKVMKPYIQEIYNENKGYVFVPVKSSEKSYYKRGFYPNEEFLKVIKGLKIKEGPKRIDNIKQGKLSIQERLVNKHEYEKIKICDENVIIFDDVIVTGQTIKCYLQNIDFVRLKNLKIIILLRGKKARG